MKQSNNTELINYLAQTNQFYVADLITIQPAHLTGVYYRFTNADFDITVNGVTYSSNLFGYKRSGTKIKIGLEVDEMTLDLWPLDPNYKIDENTIGLVTTNGYWDNAKVSVYRQFMPSFGDIRSNFNVWMFSGIICSADPQRSQVTFTVKSEIDKLNIPTPRNVFQPGCVNTFGDSACGVVLANYTLSATITSLDSINPNTILYASYTSPQGVLIPFDDPLSTGYFNNGYVSFSTGPNTGYKRPIRLQENTSTVIGSNTVRKITLSAPLPYIPTVGATISLTPGCSKTINADGCSRYYPTTYKTRFRGFPFVPPVEESL